MITSLTIENFKAFQYAELNLTELNLLTGVNGVGKSSVLQALLLLRQSRGMNGLSLKGDLIDIGQGKDALNINANSDGYSDYLFFQIESSAGGKWSYKYGYSANSDYLEAIEKSSNTELDFTYLFSETHFQYLNAERVSPSVFSDASAHQVRQLRSVGKKGQYAVHFLAHYQREPVLLPSVQIASSNTLLDQVDAWFGRITAGTRLTTTYRSELNIATLTYRFESGENFTPDFTPVNVGFGFTYVLPVIVAILAARPGDLLLIENPESHLHPQGQAQLGTLLACAAADGVQIIVETHSDHLLNGVRVAVKDKKIKPEQVSVFYFERDPESEEHVTEIVRPTIDANGRLSQQPRGFFDEYARQLDRLLQ